MPLHSETAPRAGPGTEQALNKQVGDQGREDLTGTSVSRQSRKSGEVRRASNSEGGMGSGFQGKTGEGSVSIEKAFLQNAELDWVRHQRPL